MTHHVIDHNRGEKPVEATNHGMFLQGIDSELSAKALSYMSIHQRKIKSDAKESLRFPQKQARCPRWVKGKRAMSA